MRSTQLRVLSPCHENYDAMRGGGPTRFCERCEKSVTNLSDLTRTEAERFLLQHAGKSVCVRYRKRRDGEVVFRPAAPVRLAFVAAISLAMAACTGYLESEDLDSPDDALVCHDASGYAIPCEETDDATIPADVREPSPPAVEPTEPVRPEPDVEERMGIVAPDPAAGEGCPIPPPQVDAASDPHDEDVLMGDIDVSPEVLRVSKREARRQARIERRSDRRLARQR
jgi:hypothetical protein